VSDGILVVEVAVAQLVVESGGAPVVLAVEQQVANLVAVAEQGPAGPQGAQGPANSTVVRTAQGTLSGHRVVCSAGGGLVRYASANDSTSVGSIEGVTIGAVADGAAASIQLAGEMVEPSWSWTPGPVFLGLAGQLTQTLPSSGFIVQIGVATAAATLLISPRTPILTAQ
jgi:hypothetical protein